MPARRADLTPVYSSALRLAAPFYIPSPEQMLIPQTRLAAAPFPGKAPKPPRSYKDLDLAKVQKTRDPYKPERVIAEHKYDTLFANVAEGDCFVVEGGVNELSALARALRLYLSRKGLKGIVRQQLRCADGLGRVWLLRLEGGK